MLKFQKTIDILKVDVEYNEWGALKKMLEEKALDRVKQFVFEIHTSEVLKRKSSLDDLVRYSFVLHQLELLGFRKWHWHLNKFGQFRGRNFSKMSCCYELSYINSKYFVSEMEMGQWVMGHTHGSNGSPFLDGSHGSHHMGHG